MSAVGRVVTAVEGAGVVGHSVEIVGRRRAARGRLPAVVTGWDAAESSSNYESNYKLP